MPTTEVNGANIQNAYTQAEANDARIQANTAFHGSGTPGTSGGGNADWSTLERVKVKMDFLNQTITGVNLGGGANDPRIPQIKLSSALPTAQTTATNGRVVIDGIYTPVSTTDNSAVKYTAASKHYVDEKIAQSDMGISWKNAVQFRTTRADPTDKLSGDLSGEYIIMADGKHKLKGHTADDFFGGSSGELLDHNVPLDNDEAMTDGVPTRILVMNQINSAENGIYEITALGSTITAVGGEVWELTRTSDADGVNGANDLQRAAVYVDKGALYHGTGYVESGNWDPHPSVLGSHDIDFSLMANIQGVHADDGLVLEGRHIRVNVGDNANYPTMTLDGDVLAVGVIDTDNVADKAIDQDRLSSAAFVTGDTAAETIANNSRAVSNEHIKTSAIRERHIKAGDITGSKIKKVIGVAYGHADNLDRAIDGEHIRDDSIIARHYSDRSIDTKKLATSSVCGSAIEADTSVIKVQSIKGGVGGDIAYMTITGGGTSGNIAQDSITNYAMADDSIQTLQIKNNNVTTDKLSPGASGDQDSLGATVAYSHAAVSAVHLQNNSVTPRSIATDAVDGSKIADDSIDTEHISSEAIEKEHIAAENVLDTHLKGRVIDSTPGLEGYNHDTCAVSANKIRDGAIKTRAIAALAITGAKIAKDTITGANSVGAGHIGSEAIFSYNIKGGTIEVGDMASNSVGTNQIIDGNVTIGKLSPGTPADTLLGVTVAYSRAAVGSAVIQSNTIIARHVTGTGTWAQNSDTATSYTGGAYAFDADLGPPAITSFKIAEHAIDMYHYKPKSIRSNQLGGEGPSGQTGDALEYNDLSRAVDTKNILDYAVVTRCIRDGNVTSGKIQSHESDTSKRAVGSDHVQIKAINNSHIADYTIEHDKLKGKEGNDDDGYTYTNAAVTNDKIRDGAIDNRCISSKTITSDKLSIIDGNKISASQMEDEAIEGSTGPTLDIKGQIKLNSITIKEMATLSIGTDQLVGDADNNGCVTAQKLAQDPTSNSKRAVGTDHIQTKCVEGGGAAAGPDESKIAAGTIADIDIAAEAITNRALGLACVKSANIEADAVTEAHCNFGNLNVGGTIHAQAVILGGSGSAQGTINLAKIKSISVKFNQPSPQELYIKNIESGLGHAKGWWTWHGKHSLGEPQPASDQRTSLLEWIERSSSASGIIISEVDTTDLAVPAGHPILTGATEPLYTGIGLWAAGWSLPTINGANVAGLLPLGNISSPGLLEVATAATASNLEVRVPMSNSVVGGKRGHLAFSAAEKVRGILIMWSCMIRTAGYQPASVVAKTYVSTKKVADNLKFPPTSTGTGGVTVTNPTEVGQMPEAGTRLVDIKTIHTDLTTTGYTAVVHTTLSSQSTFIDVSTEASSGGIYIENVWVELSYPRPAVTDVGAWGADTKVIIPNDTTYSLMSLIISDGSSKLEELVARSDEHVGSESTLISNAYS
jgi:hypothetical protein